MDHDARESLLESLYSAHSADVLRYALRRGADYPDAEEVVVETFTVCWRRLDEVPDPALPWLLAVARRVLSNQWRAKRRRVALRGKLETIEHRVAAGASDGDPDPIELRKALASLHNPEREVLALVVWGGLTHEAAATVLGCTRNAVTKRYLRACRSLKAQLSAGRT